MTIKFFAVVFMLTTIFSCKQNKAEDISETIDVIVNQDITEKDLSKLSFTEFVLDAKTENIVKNWREYYQIQDAVKKAKKGDLSFFKDNDVEIKTILKDLVLNIPDSVDSDATLARILALETKLYKLESLSNLPTTSKKELSNTIKEFLESFSNFNFQMNKKIEKDSRIIEKP
jgi:hypothetical protein